MNTAEHTADQIQKTHLPADTAASITDQAPTPVVTYAMLLQSYDGALKLGTRCKSVTCANSSISPLEGALVLGVVVLSAEPVSGIVHWRRLRDRSLAVDQPAAAPYKAFQVDDETVFAAGSAEQAAALFQEEFGEVCAYGYPRELTDQELDQPFPVVDGDEQPMGENTSLREELRAQTEPGFLAGRDC